MLEESFEKFTLLYKRPVPDGMGGYTREWVDGVQFEGSLDKDDDLQGRVAEQQGVTSVYTIITRKDIDLDFHDVFRRLSDGLTYRVTGDIKDSQTPKSAGLQYAWVPVERWDLPSD
jgi:hypothetical protein